MTAPLVSIVIPARDEEQHIEACLDAIAAQQYPHDRLEVIVVVDGGTTDATMDRAVTRLRSSDYARHLVLVNPNGSTPGNLNLGLGHARGVVVCRVDARSVIPPEYVLRCQELLMTRPGLSVVGGAQVAVVPRHDARGAGIARALNNRWGMGGSRYRRGARSGPSDTVYLGAFRTADLRAVGGWDAALPTNQDFDLNRRLAARGTVWFDSSLEVGYVPRPTVAALYRQYHRFGRWKVRYWRHTGDAPRARQVILLVGVPALAVVAALGFVLAPTSGKAVLLGGALAVAGAVETLGSRRPHGGLTVHGWSAVALAAVGAAWLAGAWRELLGREATP